MTKTLSLLAGVAMIASAGAVSAGELLSANQMDQVSAGGFYFSKAYRGHVSEDIRSRLDLDGNAAEASAEAHALGNGKGSDETLAITGTTAYAFEPGALCRWCGGESYSASVSVAAVD